MMPWATQETGVRSEEHTSELQSHSDLVCRLLLEKKKEPKCEYNQTITAYERRYSLKKIHNCMLLCMDSGLFHDQGSTPICSIFFLMIRQPPRTTLFPDTTLFR